MSERDLEVAAVLVTAFVLGSFGQLAQAVVFAVIAGMCSVLRRAGAT